MPAPRLPGAERRASIVTAAKAVFARYGLEGARTQQIAKAAGISEALLFRHFASKTQIYRAVLREVVADQNATFHAMGPLVATTEGLLAMIHRTIAHAMLGARASNAEGMRMVVGSLAADGGYARLVYRRALRLAAPTLEQALRQAWTEGALVGAPMATANAVAFLEHVSTMMLMARCHPQTTVTYAGADAVVMREAIAFCARGLGISPQRVDGFLKSLEV